MGAGRAEGLVRSLDTNVLARFLVRDDIAQTRTADRVLGSDVTVTATVMLETAWLLASRFGLSRAEVAGGLAEIVGMDNVRIADEPRILWAIDRMRRGADFADMLHLVGSRDASLFTTFDRDVARAAGSEPPVEIETLST